MMNINNQFSVNQNLIKIIFKYFIAPKIQIYFSINYFKYNIGHRIEIYNTHS